MPTKKVKPVVLSQAVLDLARSKAGAADIEIHPRQIRALRQGAGWSQADLARRVGVAAKTVSCWECGHFKPRGAKRKLLVKMIQERG